MNLLVSSSSGAMTNLWSRPVAAVDGDDGATTIHTVGLGRRLRRHADTSERRIDAQQEHVRSGGGVADCAIREHVAVFVPDAAAADEIERCESLHADVFGEELHAGLYEPGRADYELILTSPTARRPDPL